MLRCPEEGLKMATRLSKRLELDYSNVLVAIFELMLSAGIDVKDLETACMTSLSRAEARARLGRRDETGGLVTAALVLDAWHRDRRYLNARAMPKAVPLLGPAPSVEAIVRSQRLRKDSAEIARRLKTLRLVVPSGRRRLYKPASDVAVISAQEPLVLQYTVGRNVSSKRSLEPLIERIAEVPDLPRKYVDAFQRFTQAQGKTFLRTINDWLESRCARRSPREGVSTTVRAGVHTYAYFAPKRRAAGSPKT
jgi:hypothetical protein